MKRIVAIFLIAVFLLGAFAGTAEASERDVNTIYFADGSYMVEAIEVINMRASGSITGNKRYTYYDSDDVSQWRVTLTGKFTYTGSSATCTSSSVDVAIYDSSWYISSKSASKSGNKATGNVKMGDRPVDVTLSIVPVNLTLTCDANGNLS